MKELKFEELTIKQKLGMVFTPVLNTSLESKEEEEFIYQLIRDHSLGSVWIQQSQREPEAFIAKVKEIADYPIVIMTDAESGIVTETEQFLVGRHSAISNTGDPKYAYAFGKVLGTKAHQMGYNMVCNPILDIIPGHIRSLGGDKETVAQYAVAMAKGLHDGGVMALGKHYPGGGNPSGIDSHMAESISYATKEELISEWLYPYKKLMDEGLLDGIMTGHKRMVNIDPNRPASLSKSVIDVIREMGFEGFVITDALIMMGIKAKYSDVEASGYAIAAGNDSILPYTWCSRQRFSDLCTAYDQGLIPDEMLDAAVKRVLATQKKVLSLPDDAKITEEEMELFQHIDQDGVVSVTDQGLTTSISRDGNHYFAILLDNDYQYGEGGQIVEVDTFSTSWHHPNKIAERLKELFPNSKSGFLYELPRAWQNNHVLSDSLGCDEVVFLTYTEPKAYQGKECLTRRLISLMEAMQYTGRISTLVHFGNPKVLEELPHIPRKILCGMSEKGVKAGLDVLSGSYPAKGKLTCQVEFK